MRGTSVGRRGLLVLAVVAVCLCGVQGAYAGGPKPVITGAMATPSSVPSAGTITVSASVSGATSCTLSSNKTVAGLPATSSCESGGYSREVVMPENLGKKPADYKLTLAATGAGGKGKAKITVAVGFPVATGVSAGEEDSCAVLANGRVKCWGRNNEGQIGDGKESKKEALVPVEVLGVTDAVQVSTGYRDACALLSSGHIKCWGRNHSGQLGDGTTTNKPTPVEVQGITEATEVDAGVTTCARLADGHIECWGENDHGSLGNGTQSKAATTVPVEVNGIADAVQVVGGGSTICAVLTTGRIECWGENYYGGLGDGMETGPEHCQEVSFCSTVPVEALGITTASQAGSGASDHECAVLADGHIECWGQNGAGELGTGSEMGPETCKEPSARACSVSPVEVENITDASAVADGGAHSCAVLADSHVECWGVNVSGQLGNGEGGKGFPNESQISATPVEALGIASAVEVTAGGSHTCALLSSGHIQCWGNDVYGELGNNSETDSDVPVNVTGI